MFVQEKWTKEEKFPLIEHKIKVLMVELSVELFLEDNERIYLLVEPTKNPIHSPMETFRCHSVWTSSFSIELDAMFFFVSQSAMSIAKMNEWISICMYITHQIRSIEQISSREKRNERKCIDLEKWNLTFSRWWILLIDEEKFFFFCSRLEKKKAKKKTHNESRHIFCINDHWSRTVAEKNLVTFSALRKATTRYDFFFFVT